MSQNQEIIEAKLCAFIDGELDAEGRIEIEKHLEANPQHRRLLESLKATRDLIKWLPREAAPPEVAETLNGQLERSVLLDSDSDFLRPSYWPRAMAAAAIVLLTAGLGVAVYFTLPKSQKSATPYASKAGPDLPGGEGSTEDGKSDEGLGRREGGAGGTLSKGGVSDMRASRAASSEVAKSESSKADAEELKNWVNQNRDALNAVAAGQNQAGIQNTPVASNAVVMLVRSNAPQTAQKQVTEFLDAQKIQWKETSSTPDNGQVQNGIGDSYRGQQQIRQERVSQSSPLAQQQSQSQLVAVPTTAISKSAAEALQDNNTTQPSPSGSVKSSADRLVPVQRMYIARMLRSQAVNLGNAMAQEPAQTTQYKDLAGATVSLADLGAGKVPAPFGMANAAATEPSTAAQMANQADRAVRRRSDTQSAPGFAGSGIGGGFGGGGGGRGGGGGFSGAKFSATAPSTQTAQEGQAAQQVQAPSSFQAIFPDTRPAQAIGSAAGQGVSTQPSTTQPADETVDIVIVVESSPAEGGNVALPPAVSPAAPTTQPVQVPAATQPAGDH